MDNLLHFVSLEPAALEQPLGDLVHRGAHAADQAPGIRRALGQDRGDPLPEIAVTSEERVRVLR